MSVSQFHDHPVKNFHLRLMIMKMWKCLYFEILYMQGDDTA